MLRTADNFKHAGLRVSSYAAHDTLMSNLLGISQGKWLGNADAENVVCRRAP